MTAAKGQRWFVTQRMSFIAETLRIFGAIQRRHLCLKFGISVQQASHDLGNFSGLYPGLMRYDARAKQYVRAKP